MKSTRQHAVFASNVSKLRKSHPSITCDVTRQGLSEGVQRGVGLNLPLNQTPGHQRGGGGTKVNPNGIGFHFPPPFEPKGVWLVPLGFGFSKPPPQDPSSARQPSFCPLSRHNFHYVFPLLGVPSWNFGVFEAPGPQMCTFGVLGLSCEAPAAPVHDAVFFVPNAVFLLPECFFFVPLTFFIPFVFFSLPLRFFVPLPHRHSLRTRDPTHVPRDSGVKSCRATSLSPLSCSQIFLVLTATTAAPKGAGAAKPLHATSWPLSPGTRPHWIHTCMSGFVSFPKPEDQLWTLAGRRCTNHTHDHCGRTLACTLQWTARPPTNSHTAFLPLATLAHLGTMVHS